MNNDWHQSRLGRKKAKKANRLLANVAGEKPLRKELGDLKPQQEPFARHQFRKIMFDQVFEILTSIIFLIIGLWGTAFAYGWVGPKLVGGLQWRPEFQRPMRWLGSLMVFASVGALVFLFR